MINFSYSSRSDMGYTKVSAGIITNPSIVNNGDGTLTLSEGIYMLFYGENYNLPLVPYTIPSATYSFIDKVSNYIVAISNNGVATISVTTDKSIINQSNVIEVLNVYRDGTRLEYNDFVSDPSNGLANRISDMLGRVYGFIVEPNSFALGETGTRYVTISDGYVWDGGSKKKYLQSFNSSSNAMLLYQHSGGEWTTSQISSYVNNQYDDGTNLQPMSSLTYVPNWIFRHVASSKTFIVLGTQYFLLNSAKASPIPSDLPEEILSQSILVGRIIVGRNNSTSSETTSAFEKKYETSPVYDHESLSNLQGGTSGEHYHLSLADLDKFENSLRLDQTIQQSTIGRFSFPAIETQEVLVKANSTLSYTNGVLTGISYGNGTSKVLEYNVDGSLHTLTISIPGKLNVVKTYVYSNGVLTGVTVS